VAGEVVIMSEEEEEDMLDLGDDGGEMVNNNL
jgi:hypothetical protein